MITSLDRSISAASDEIAFLRARQLTFRRRGAGVNDTDDDVRRDGYSADFEPLSTASKEERQNPAENTQTPTVTSTAETKVTRSSDVEGVAEESHCPPRQPSSSTSKEAVVGESGRKETGSRKMEASVSDGYNRCVGSEEETSCTRKDGGIKATSRVDPSMLPYTRAPPRSKTEKIDTGCAGTKRKLRSEGVLPKPSTISTEARRGSSTKKASVGHERYTAMPIIGRIRSFGELHLSRSKFPPPLPPRSQPRSPLLHQEDARASWKIPTDVPETGRNRATKHLVDPSGLFDRARTTGGVGARSLIVVDGLRLVWTLGIRDGIVSEAIVTRCRGTNGYGRNHEYRVGPLLHRDERLPGDVIRKPMSRNLTTGTIRCYSDTESTE